MNDSIAERRLDALAENKEPTVEDTVSVKNKIYITELDMAA